METDDCRFVLYKRLLAPYNNRSYMTTGPATNIAVGPAFYRTCRPAFYRSRNKTGLGISELVGYLVDRNSVL